MVCLDGEGKTAQAVRAAHAQCSMRLVRRRGGRALETVDCIVDLNGNGGATLGVIGVRLREDELSGQLDRRDSGSH